MDENTKYSPMIISGPGIFSVKLPSVSDTEHIVFCLSKNTFTVKRIVPLLIGIMSSNS